MGHGEGLGIEVWRGSRGEGMYGGTYRDMGSWVRDGLEDYIVLYGSN